jgi:hypothetical protein
MIHYTSDTFDFNRISLSTPSVNKDGTYFSKIANQGDSMYVYSPKCKTSGLIASGAKQYTELSFSMDESFVSWIETLEERIQSLIFENRHTWFATETIELDDVQNAFMPILKFKHSLFTVRGHFPIRKHPCKEPIVQVYNEDEIEIPIASIKDSPVLSILDVHGINFTQKSFQVLVYVRQMMVLEQPLFPKCKIKNKGETWPVDISDTIAPMDISEVIEIVEFKDLGE